MKTYEIEREQLQKEARALEKKGLKIGLGYKFERTHGNKDCVKVLDYDNDYVKIQDANGLHFVPRVKFSADNFRKGV